MDKHKAIPQGYMTVGEVAKKMDVTVRTLPFCRSRHRKKFSAITSCASRSA